MVKWTLAYTVLHSLGLGVRECKVWSARSAMGAFVLLFTCGGELLFAHVWASVGLGEGIMHF